MSLVSIAHSQFTSALREFVREQKKVFAIIAISSLTISTFVTVRETQSPQNAQEADAAFTITENSIASTTDTLRLQLASYDAQTATKKTEIKALAEARKQYLLQTLHKDPQAFLSAIELDDTFTSLPSKVQVEFKNSIERRIEDEGSLYTIHMDNEIAPFETKGFTSTKTNQSYEVYNLQQSKIERANVRLKGIMLGGSVVVPEDSRGTLQETSSLTAVSVSGAQKTAVVLLEFNNSSPSERNFTIDDVRQRVYLASDSVRNFFEKTSYYGSSSRGLTLSGDPVADVYGWVTINYPKPKSSSDCDWASINNWGSDARSKAKVASGYSKVIYIWPRQTVCTAPLIEGTWNGFAQLPGTNSFINGAVTTRTLAHELGHNLGIQHSISMSCPNAAVGYYDKCRLPRNGGSGVSNYEYGDKYDVMGSGGKFLENGDVGVNTAAHINAVYKMQAGWLDSARMRTVTTSTNNIPLLPLAFYNSTGTQVIRIPKPIGTENERFSEDYYYVEYRIPQGIDNIWSINKLAPAGGIVIHISGNQKYLHTGTGSSGARTVTLIDAIAPFDANFADAALKNPGSATDTFSDPPTMNNIKVRFTGVTFSPIIPNIPTAMVCVDIGGTGICDKAPVPSVSPTRVPTITPSPKSSATATPRPSNTPTQRLTPTAALPVPLTLVSSVGKATHTTRVQGIQIVTTLRNNTATPARSIRIQGYVPDTFVPNNGYRIGIGGCTTSIGTASTIGGTLGFCQVDIPLLNPGQQVTFTSTGVLLQNNIYPRPTTNITMSYTIVSYSTGVGNVKYSSWRRSMLYTP